MPILPEVLTEKDEDGIISIEIGVDEFIDYIESGGAYIDWCNKILLLNNAYAATGYGSISNEVMNDAMKKPQ